jgi:hypothetical protein
MHREAVMKSLERFAAAVLVVSSTFVNAYGAGPPSIDRPSPPACCADGLCYPNRDTWGVYKTRWRRWPTEQLQPTPAEAQPPVGPTQEIPGFERPPMEDEEQAAPPPTRAAEEAREEEEEDSRQQTPPATLPFGTPPDTGTQPAPPSPLENNQPAPPGMRFLWETDETTTPTTTPLNDGMPTGDLDPPPVPPFARPSLVERDPAPATERPAVPRVQPRTAPTRPAPSHDPPPAFPIAMASVR